MIRRAVATLATAALLACGSVTAQAAYLPNPGPTTNIPREAGSSQAQQFVLNDRLTALIDETPRGEQITMTTFSMNDGDRYRTRDDVVSALVRAHRRGVIVRVVTWHHTDGQYVDRLKRELGTNIHKPSFIAVCNGSCLQSKRSKGDTDSHHAKAATFSLVRVGKRSVRHVTVIGSNNATASAGRDSWNDAETITPAMGPCAAKLFTWTGLYIMRMRFDRTAYNYPAFHCGGIRAYGAPFTNWQAHRPLLDILNHTSCGSRRTPTHIRVVNFIWSRSRHAEADRLAWLQRHGCDVRVIYDGLVTNKSVLRTLHKAKIPTWDARTKKGTYPHAKVVSIDGQVWGRYHVIKKTGSDNLTMSAITVNTDITLIIDGSVGRVVLAKRWFNLVASHSRRTR